MGTQSTELSEHGSAPGGHMPGEVSAGGHPHLHGRPVSWALVSVVIAAFTADGLAIVNHLWWLFWMCLALTVLAVPAGKIIGIMDDTALAGDPAQQAGQVGDIAADRARPCTRGWTSAAPGGKRRHCWPLPSPKTCPPYAAAAEPAPRPR